MPHSQLSFHLHSWDLLWPSSLGCGKSKDLSLLFFLKLQLPQKRQWKLEGGHWKSLGVAEVALESQRSLSASWEGSRLQKPSPQNTKSTFAQTRLSLVAEIRIALSSLVSIATLWLLLWRKELDKMTEGKKEREKGLTWFQPQLDQIHHTPLS